MKNLIEVFKDTLNTSMKKNNGVTTIHTNDEIKQISHKYHFNGNIKVINLDSVSALTEYSKYGKTCVLNMASYKRPGGGVRNGAMAQEECLFRCSNLINSIPNTFYPLEDNECLYTKDAVFFKDFNYNYIDDVICDVITIAAINLNVVKQDSNYRGITLDKIRLMLTLPAKNGVKNIILGAFGCGVFKNDPNIISEFFREVLIEEGYSSLYENVIFAVINDHNSVRNNYNSFLKKFQ